MKYSYKIIYFDRPITNNKITWKEIYIEELINGTSNAIHNLEDCLDIEELESGTISEMKAKKRIKNWIVKNHPELTL